MFDPPNDGRIRDAYIIGYRHAQNGRSSKDNPYTPSGHERDTTLQDELHYEWSRGFDDFGGALWEGSVCDACGKAEVKDGKMSEHDENCPDGP